MAEGHINASFTCETVETSANLPRPSADLPRPSADLPETSTSLPEPSTDLLEPSTDLPEPSTDLPPPYSKVITCISMEGTKQDKENMASNMQPHGSDKLSPSSRVSSLLSVFSLTNRLSPEQIEGGRACCHRSTGLLLAFISGVLMTAYSAMIKFLVEMDSMQVVVIRGTMQAVLLGGVACYKKNSFLGKREPWVPLLIFLVALTGGLRILFIFTSVARLPLGDSTTILFSSPVFVMVFSIFLLKVARL